MRAAQIEGGGTLKHENNWGLRKMAYEIGQRNEADYRWFRFEAPAELLDQLDHNLKIADGVLRFRIFKVDPDAPVMVPPAAGAPGPPPRARRPHGRRPPRRGRAASSAEEPPAGRRGRRPAHRAEKLRPRLEVRAEGRSASRRPQFLRRLRGEGGESRRCALLDWYPDNDSEE